MTTRYLLVTGDPAGRVGDIAVAVSQARGLSVTHIRPNVALLSNKAAVALGPAGPVVIGTCYGSHLPDTPPSPAMLAEPADFVTACWGRYCAIWLGSEGLRILRDPAGGLPCYYRCVGTMTLVASDLDLLELAVPVPRRINWDEVSRILGAGDLRSPATGLVATDELPAGNLLCIKPDRCSVTQVWDPWRFASQSSGARIEEGAARLRETIDRVVTALGAPHPNALATISGGLDSSIVALSLSPIVRSLTCFTAATEDPSGDERRYARLVADAASADYRERYLDPGHVSLERSQVSHLPRPIGRPFMQSLARIIGEAATDAGATAVFNGSGGDNVFCFLQSATPVADRLLAEGLRKALSTLRDVAVMSGASYLEVTQAVLRRSMSTGGTYRWRDNRRFLAKSERTDEATFTHPWLRARPEARIGSIAHIAMLLRMQNYLDPWSDEEAFEVLNPLMSQPIIELCLTIPSWVWCTGGRNRAVARHAFADRLPGPVLRRTWKGGPDAFIGKLAENNRAFLRDRLVNGELSARHILDRGAILEVLDQPRPMSASDALRLLALTDAEAWVRTMA